MSYRKELSQWISGSRAVVWNFCVSHGLSFYLPRRRKNITCSHDNILFRRDQKEEVSLIVLAYCWRKIIPRSIPCRPSSLRSQWPISMPVTDLGAQWLATAAMIHPQGQAHCHLYKNGICWNRRKRGMSLVELSKRVPQKESTWALCVTHGISFLSASLLAPFLPTYTTVGTAYKASASAWTLAVEFEVAAFSANLISHRSHLLIPTDSFTQLGTLCFAYVLGAHPGCNIC